MLVSLKIWNTAVDIRPLTDKLTASRKSKLLHEIVFNKIRKVTTRVLLSFEPVTSDDGN